MSKEQRLIIYHTSDMHNRMGALNYLAAAGKDADTLILDSGDALSGSNTVFKFSEPIIKKMNEISYDAMAMGNREFNYLRWVLKIRHREAAFPILCANLKDDRNVADSYYSRYIIKKVNGLNVGIFGLTPVQYRTDSKWRAIMRFKFIDPKDCSKEIISEIKEKVNLVILLSHLGLEEDKKIAQEVEGIDLIFGGHTHDILKEPLRVNGVYIFHPGSHGRFCGRAEITVDSDEKIKELNYVLYST